MPAPPTPFKAAKVMWVAGMLALTGLGTVDMVVPLVPRGHLAGVEVPVQAPKLGALPIWNESYQHTAVAWFDQNWGLRGPFVRTDNTLNIGLFAETRSGQHIVIGKDGVLFNYEDAGYLNRPDGPEPALEAGRVIARVQQKARAHGYALIPIIIPSKTSVYRAEYPSSHRRRGVFELSDTNIYGALLRGLTENNARFVDARATILAEARGSDEVFAKTARHWRWPAACRALQLAIDLARSEVPELGNEQVDCHFRIEPAPWVDDGWDLDLFNLLNRWLPPPREVEGRKLDGRRGGLRFPTLFVGSSFVTMFANISRELDVLQPSHFYYYNGQASDTLRPNLTWKVEPHTARWREDTFSKRLWIVGILETFAPGDGLGFMGEIEQELDALPPPRGETFSPP